MFSPETLSEQLLLSVVRFEALVDGEWLPSTAFLFRFQPVDREPVLALIMNKHARENASQLRVFFHFGVPTSATTAEPSGALRPAAIDDIHVGWVDHPSADVCAYPCRKLIEAVEAETGLRVFQRALDRSIIWSDDELKKLSAAEDVLMVGYPDGIWDSANNLPLLRRGMTATHACLDFCGSPEGVIDIAAIGGSSGSPVLILSEGHHFNKKASAGKAALGAGDRVVLLGIAAEAALMNLEGKIEKRAIPMRRKELYALTAVSIHLAYYVKAKELLVLEAAL